MTAAARGRSKRHRRRGRIGSCAPPGLIGAKVGPRLARLVDGENPVAYCVAQAVEKAPAAETMTPSLGDDAFRIGAEVEELRPFLVVERARVCGPRDMRFAPVAEFDFRPLDASMRAGDQEHGPALNARRPPRRLRR